MKISYLRRYLLVFDHVRLVAEQEACARLAELGYARDQRVLLVELFMRDQLLGSSHTVEHVRFAGVVSVRAHAQVDLARVGVAAEGVCDTDDRIRWRLFHARPP